MMYASTFALLAQDPHRVEHRRQQRAHLHPPRSRQQRDAQRVRLARGFADVRELLDERMSDVGHRHVVRFVELFLEREDDEHPVDVLRDVPHSPPPPGPELRRDVVDDVQPQLLAALGQAQVELGIVDEEDDVRTFALDLLDDLIEDAPEHRQMAEDVEEADDAHLAGVMEERHPLAREQVAADAEHLQFRIELLQLAHDFGRV